MARSDQLKRRAERQDETRPRIIEAAIELHQTIGPAAATVTEIAHGRGDRLPPLSRRADLRPRLQRPVLRAPDPPPDPDGWAGIALALSFDTWRTLTLDQELTDTQAVELMFPAELRVRGRRRLSEGGPAPKAGPHVG
jgi:hypothetical protein